MFEYFDGNGNKYLITYENKKIIEYIPMKPHLSSSGVYNGGDYIKKEINNQELNNIKIIFNQAKREKESHMKNRVKMSGMIIFHGKNSKETYIIEPMSDIQMEIERTLKDILEK